MVLFSKPIKRLAKIESQLGRLDFLMPDIVQVELERLAQNAGPKRSRLAKTALELAKIKFNTVATIDTNLRRRLIANQVLVLSLRKDNLIIANPKINPKDHL
jgi:rRNA-processing protein FCF1